MARAGRRRKLGDRYPCGKRKLDPAGPAPGVSKRLEWAHGVGIETTPERAALDGDFGTVVGMLHLAEPTEFPRYTVDAATSLLTFFGRHDRLVGNIRRTSKSLDYERGRVQAHPSDTEIDAEVVKANVKEMQDIRFGLGPAFSVTYNSIVLNQPATGPDRKILRAGLDWLCGHFKIEKEPEAKADLRRSGENPHELRS